MNYIKKHSFKVTLVIVFLLIFILNCLVPYVADDYTYMISDGISDIFAKEYVQYMTWCGRSVAHIIARSFLSLPKIIFNIANSLVFVLLTLLVHFHILGKKDFTNTINYILACCFIFIFVPSFGQTVLWETGSCNYLWMTTIILLFLLPFRLHLSNSNYKIKIIYIIILALCSGWSNENSGGATIMLLTLLTIYQYFIVKDKHIIKNIIGIIFCLTGYIILLLAPGNSVRASSITVNTSLYGIVHKVIDVLDMYKQGFLVLLVIFLIALALNIIYNKKKTNYYYPVIYSLSGLACAFAMALSPVRVLFDRSMFCAIIFFIIATLTLIQDCLGIKNINNIVTAVSLASSVLFTFVNYCYGFVDIAYSYLQNRSRVNYINYQKENGNYNPVIGGFNSEFYTDYNPVKGQIDVDTNKKYKLNVDESQYYGLETIRSCDSATFDLIYKDGLPRLMNIQDMENYLKYIVDNNLMFIVTTTTLDSEYDGWLEMFNAAFNTEFNNDNYVIIYGQGSQIYHSNGSETPIEYSTNINQQVLYVSSNEKRDLSDIAIDDVEYSLNNFGITIVVYNPVTQKALDSVTFNTAHWFGDAVRYYD